MPPWPFPYGRAVRPPSLEAVELQGSSCRSASPLTTPWRARRVCQRRHVGSRPCHQAPYHEEGFEPGFFAPYKLSWTRRTGCSKATTGGSARLPRPSTSQPSRAPVWRIGTLCMMRAGSAPRPRRRRRRPERRVWRRSDRGFAHIHSFNPSGKTLEASKPCQARTAPTQECNVWSASKALL